MAGSSWHQTPLGGSLPSNGVRSSLGHRCSFHSGGGRSHRGDTGRPGHSWFPSGLGGIVGSSQGPSSQPGSSRSHPRGGRRSGYYTCRVRSVCHSGQVGRVSGRRGLEIQVHTHNCHFQGHRCLHSCRCRYCYSWLPRSPRGRAGGSGYPSSQPGIGSVHGPGHSHQNGHSHSDWHNLCQTAPSGRAAGSGPRATLGCRYRHQFGGYRLRHGHTGSWHCS